MRPSLRTTCSVVLCTFLGASSVLAQQVIQQGAALADQRRPSAGAAAAAAGQNAALQAVPEDFSNLPLAPGYLLAMQVFGVQDLSGEFRIDPSGDLVLPLVDKVHVAGLTVTEAQDKIARALKDGDFIQRPNVTLTVTQYVPTTVTILGEVQSPGKYPLLQPHTVQDVLALAGGPTMLAAGTIDIKRLEAGQDKHITLPLRRDASASPEDTEIKPGDIVTVRRAGVVYVLGGVFRPGGYVMQENGRLDVTQAIALAAGTTLQASVGSIRVLRRMQDGSILEYPIDYKGMMSGKVASLQLQPQDVVYVPLSKIKTALTEGATQVIGGASSAVIYRY
jgi:polysaccharide export outer membrane protein